MTVKLIAGFIVAGCIALILYFYDTIRLDFYYILAGFIVAAVSFAAGWHEAKGRYKCQELSDAQVEGIVRAFWRRIYTYRNDHGGKELPKPLPAIFKAHMTTALLLLKKKHQIV